MKQQLSSSKKISFRNAIFAISATELQGMPKPLLPEIAITGRSNVGKSSLINHLTQHTRLAFSSSMPGKTRCANFYTIDKQLTLVDLPGYGFAAVSKKEQAKWGPWIDTYLKERESLKLILFLFDIRRDFSDEDFAFIEWAKQQNKGMQLLFVKCDTVKDREKRAQELFSQVGMPYLLYTTKESSARAALTDMLQKQAAQWS